MADTPCSPGPPKTPIDREPVARGEPLGSPGATKPRSLIIVAREELGLWRHVVQYTGELKGVQILLDRRQRERRQLGQPVAQERRRADRRRPPTAEGDLRRHPFLLVTQE